MANLHGFRLTTTFLDESSGANKLFLTSSPLLSFLQSKNILVSYTFVLFIMMYTYVYWTDNVGRARGSWNRLREIMK